MPHRPLVGREGAAEVGGHLERLDGVERCPGAAALRSGDDGTAGRSHPSLPLELRDPSLVQLSTSRSSACGATSRAASGTASSRFDFESIQP